ncbi:MAG TPA: hypothetical protein VL967_07835 [Terracidiphilus sp.]|nr:hypothetical protein [Terracidiphilus sp.]
MTRFGWRWFEKALRPVFPGVLFVALMLAGSGARAEAPWQPIGPDGGDARSLAAFPGDPNHLLLGTTNSRIYESNDGGARWHRLTRLDSGVSLVVDHIVIDPTHPDTIYAAAWALGSPGGGLWVSQDGGKDWSESPGLRGQSVRAFTEAPSNPSVLYAGTLEGVFRSRDSGATWTQISPAGSKEIHEIESLAVDPTNPEIVYAGTWHLPWKTADGGKSWHNIKKGVIDDSDVFSIIIDPKNPRVVYASACSGIYKSETSGALFRRIHGIPSTARRTRVLRQDPSNRNVVYAGTTEGLYKTINGGKTFKRMTADDVIVNDVFIDPENSQRVLLATDRGGVLASSDGAATFVAENRGISERKVAALLADFENPHRIFAGVVNDKAFGSVFVSNDDGADWKQMADGLGGRDVFALAESPEGTVAAGTSSGIFVLDRDASAWLPKNAIDHGTAAPGDPKTKADARKSGSKPPSPAPQEMLDGRVFALDLSGAVWLAATSGGLYTSSDKGATWQGGPVMGIGGYLSAAAHGSLMAAATPDSVVLSGDAGQSWRPISIPAALAHIRGLAFSSDGTLWLGGREGVYFSRDEGKSWMWLHRLPLEDVDNLSFDAGSGTVLVSSRGSDFVYAIDAKTLRWKWWQTGYRLAAARMDAGRLLAASVDDGVLAEPDESRAQSGQP